MEDEKFEKEFYRLISPITQWNGALKSIKEIFEMKILEYDITQNQAEKLLDMEKRTLEGILDRSAKRVDVINLIKLGQFLGLETKELIEVYLKELSSDIVGELENTRKKTFIISKFDIKNLYKSGFITNKTDFNYIEARILKYFGLDSIFEFQSTAYIPAFSRTKRSEHSLMREFWVRSAFMHFQKLNNPNEYRRDILVDLISKIRPYTMNVEKGLKTVSQALYNCGVSVIYQQHLPTTQVRGATFVVNGKPCIAITDLNKNYATLWFALMHELHHVLYDLNEIEKQVFHLTGEPDIFLMQEDKADEFARDFLFSPDKTKYISAHIDNSFLVNEYAKENQVHPALIYNFYCYDMQKKGKGNFWGRFKHLLPKIDVALKDFNTNSLENESIDETIVYLKEKIYTI